MEKQTVKKIDGTLMENKHYRWVVNFFPKFEGHTLIIPKRHLTTLENEGHDEMTARGELTILASRAIQQLYPGAGVEIFCQTGPGSEASIAHIHWHIVPSQPSDPLRGFDKLGQFFTIEPDEPKILIFPVPIRIAKNQLLKALAKVLSRKEETNESSDHGRRQRYPLKQRGKKSASQ